MSKIEQAIERCAELLDRESSPSKMSVRDALEFWQGIMAEAEGRLNALECDLEDAPDEEPTDG